MSDNTTKRNLLGILLLQILVVTTAPIFASQVLITAISITPVKEGDSLLITYDGNINSMSLAIGGEKHATLKISPAKLSPSLSLKKYSGTLISAVNLKAPTPASVNITFNFKQRLGRHSKKKFRKDGKNYLQIKLLGEITEKRLELSEKSLIQPVLERGIFELDGTEENKPLDYNNTDRKKISTEEFLSLFGSRIKPRPNRITNFNYTLTQESLKLALTLHNRPWYTLKSHSNPPGIELTLNKILGDFELNHPVRHDFLSNITTTRKNNNRLVMSTHFHETTEVSSKTIKNPHKRGYLLIITIKRIYPWETEAAIPNLDI